MSREESEEEGEATRVERFWKSGKVFVYKE